MKLLVFKYLLSFTLLLLLGLPQQLQAQVTVSNLFTSGMVLQQNSQPAIWGWANPGDTVKVTGSWNNLTVKTVANADKKWMLKLQTPAAKTDGSSYTITIKGQNTILLNDVLIGEVWLLSGQSNMEMPMSGWDGAPVEGSAQAIAAAGYPKIRLFIAGKKSAATPQLTIVPNWANSTWTACSPTSVASFSALGYFFGKELFTNLNIPIGLVESAWGGSSCETWANTTSLNFVADYKNKGPWKPIDANDNQTPNVLYNGMIAPLVPFTFAGVLWYQGETNVGRAQQLTDLFPAMIEGWRNDFQQKNLPFYFVQIAPYGGYGGTSEPELWEAQTYTQLLGNTGMACTLDIGDQANIHPARKEQVGHRLALWALAKNYGQPLACSGPQYRSMQIEGNKIRINFDYAQSGLKADNNAPTQFEIAGDNLAFSPAKTLIDGQTLLVWNDNVPSPKQVRYAWACTASGSLFNNDGLPATPFRTNTPAYIQPVKASLLTDTELIRQGETCKIDWITMGAPDVSLNGAPVPESGSLILKPDTVTVYTLQAKGTNSTAIQKATVNVIPEGLYNWSLNKTASSSSTYAGSNTAFAFDGNVATTWKSNISNNQWISLDLGDSVPINLIILKWSDAFGKAYQIQISGDNKNWQTIFTETAGDGKNDFIPTAKISARYVRMLGTAMGTVNGYALNEFEIYSSQKPITGALKDMNGNTMRGTPMAMGKSLTQSVAFAQNIENWKTIQNNGYNTIRVCWTDPYYKDHAQANWSVGEFLPYLDKCVANATATGMNLIINFHNVGAQQNFDKSYQFATENEFWNAVAPRYKDNNRVYYELANEPTFTMSDYLKPDFKTAYLKIYNNIRSLAPDRQILMFSFSTIAPEIVNVVENYKDQLDWSHTTVAYHLYNSTTSAAVKTLMAYHPVICTEWNYHFVASRPDFGYIMQVDGFKENAQTLENIGSGWIDWRDWDDTTLNELVDTLITDARAKNYWWGKPVPGLRVTGINIPKKNIQLVSGKSANPGIFVYPALAENQQVNWTSSDQKIATVDANGLITAVSSRKDTTVVTAKTSDGGFTATCGVTILPSETKMAYPDGNPQKIPGTIPATWFDLGGEGVGYHDTTTKNDGNGIRPNEGVDTGQLLPEGNVGGIVTGEWLEYTVDVLQDGNYTFEIQFATAGRYGQFHLEFDGVDKTGPVSVPTSGNYTKFITKKISAIALKQGVQVMRIYFDYAEYNLGTFTVSREIPTGTENPSTAEKLLVFPVPAHDKLYVLNGQSYSGYTILNVFGRIIQKGNPGNGKAIDVSSLSRGNYFIRLESKTHVETTKFIKI